MICFLYIHLKTMEKLKWAEYFIFLNEADYKSSVLEFILLGHIIVSTHLFCAEILL